MKAAAVTILEVVALGLFVRSGFLIAEWTGWLFAAAGVALIAFALERS